MAETPALPTQIEQGLTTLTQTQLAITDQESYEQALTHLALVQQMRRTITKYFADLKAPVLTAQRRLNAASKEQLERLTPVESSLNDAVANYEQTNADLDDIDADILVNAALATGIPAEPLVPRITVPAGHHRRTTISVEVTDLLALAKAVAAESAPVTCLLPNVTALTALARSDGELFALPGVRRQTHTTIVT
tara:strand:+ start:302 stop:883 length:582 start_codon:yes stop_codon:yes gene_type:complete